LVLGSVMAATVANAQLYKCSQGGAAVFTDKPCPDSGMALRGAAAGPQGSIDFQVATRHYQVSAPNVTSAYQTLKANNPDGFLGWARWKVNYRYDRSETAGLCALKQVAVHVEGDILMPEWIEEKSATEREQGIWRNMYARLKRHEDGHVQHGREFALLLKERLLGLGKVPCDELESRARQEYQLLYGNLQNRDKEYDRRTEHGLRQDNPQ
jgi:predicted secreted Zn-dependent protease